MAAQVPCSAIYNTEMAARDPHYAAREVFAEWDDPELGRVKGVNILPRVKNNPAKIWRGSPSYGQDTRDLLEEFGYSEQEIADLFEKGAVK